MAKKAKHRHEWLEWAWGNTMIGLECKICKKTKFISKDEKPLQEKREGS